MIRKQRVAGVLNNVCGWMAKALILAAIVLLGRSSEVRSEAASDISTDGHIPNPEDCGFVVDEGELTYAQVGTIDGDGHIPPFCQA